MNLAQQKIINLIAQLEMAQSKSPVSKMQVALIKAEIKKLREQVKP